jgi:acyl carrier protein
LGEIESCLIESDMINEAAVIIAKDSSGENALCAYVVPANPHAEEIDVPALRQFLAVKLPDYMVPSQFILLKELPLMANGKVNRKALEGQGTRMTGGVKYTAPGTEMEKAITGVWQDILKHDKIGIHDNFFDLGGNSMGVISLNTRLKEVLNIDIPVVTIYRYLTIHSLAQYVAQSSEREEAFREETDRTDALQKGKNRLKQRIKRRGAK